MGNNGDANFLSTNLNHDVCKNNCHKVVEILNIRWESYTIYHQYLHLSYFGLLLPVTTKAKKKLQTYLVQPLKLFDIKATDKIIKG